MHISYSAGKASDGNVIRQEKELLESMMRTQITSSRNHYLLSAKPSDFRDLMALGITDDYTMGYADHVGFRLGTAQCIRWIDPERFELTDLSLHPLVIMDRSLAEKQYMGLEKQASLNKIKSIYQSCQSVNGDFCVLFHNNVFRQGDYCWKDVYKEMINMLCFDT